MATDLDKMREALVAFFHQAYDPDSIPGGILRAIRPNRSVDWNEAEDRKRFDGNLETFVEQAEEAATILAARKQP